MYGLNAIAANNGWQYAFLGISIVFTGLIVLSAVISQLHKLLTVWNNRGEVLSALKSRWNTSPPSVAPAATVTAPPPIALDEASRQMKLIVNRIGEPFSLPKILSAAEKRGLYRPHATINALLQAGTITPDGTGYYTWNP